MKRHRRDAYPKQRTTLTLPLDSLTQAAKIARTKRVTLSTVISEALANGLQADSAAERSEEILSGYKKAFAGFSEEELLLLDGVILDTPRKRR